MIFAGDNWAGAAPEISQALVDVNTGKVLGYGSGELDNKVQARFSEVFEREVAVFFVSTGTAANSLAIASTSKPGSVTFCHEEAHINVDECGGPEFFSSSRLCAVPGINGKMDYDELLAAIARYPASFIHSGRPGCISISQATEIGTLYSPTEIRAFSRVAKQHGIALHMDGARFANAVAASGVSPAELTWKAGVDLVSFGATKNGCWCAEALLCFDHEIASELAFHHKRAGQLFSKSRFVAAQFDAYLNDGLWLSLAAHANSMAAVLSKVVREADAIRLAWEPEANEVFVIMEKNLAKILRTKGAAFYEWHEPMSRSGLVGENEELYRLVTSFATTQEEIDQFAACLSE